jgi:hypothetical protein
VGSGFGPCQCATRTSNGEEVEKLRMRGIYRGCSARSEVKQSVCGLVTGRAGEQAGMCMLQRGKRDLESACDWFLVIGNLATHVQCTRDIHLMGSGGANEARHP